MNVGKGLKYAGIAVVALVVLVVVGFLLGVFGVPSVESVDNEFGDVNESTTEVHTTITVSNPNPFGVSLGGLTVDYTVDMNEVEMANGQKEGLSISSGNSSIELTTYLNNTRIPTWWYNHISDGEQSDVVVDATASHSTFGERDFQQTKSVETDILSSFNSTETRPIDANAPVVSDPVLYLNRTSATYGDEVTPEQTPLDMSFSLYNPKPYPYVITRVGYTIDMNNVTVGEGETDRNTAIVPRSTQTITAATVIQNERLDEWWVTHVQNDQVTDLYVDMYVVVKPNRDTVPLEDAPAIRIDSEELDYQETIETDVFGTKSDNGTATNGGQNDSTTQDGTATTEDETTTDGDTQTEDDSTDSTEATEEDGTQTTEEDSAQTTEEDDGLLD